MSFIWARMLWFLLLIPALVAAYIIAQRRRRKYALRYASLSLVKDALGRGPGFRRHVPAALFLAGLALMIAALARPAALVTLPSQRSTVILTLDISGSMRAEDMKPNRIEAAKAAARAFVEKQPGAVRIGVVAFSSTAALVQAPTTDRQKVLEAIDRLKTQRGTAVGSGIIVSLDAIFENATGISVPTQPLYRRGGGQQFGNQDWSQQPQSESTQTPREPVEPGSYREAVVILLSDGQSNQGPDPLKVVEQTADFGVRIFTVGIGSTQGAVIGVQGRSIRVQLNEEILKQIAKETEAEYFSASDESDLLEIYKKISTKLVMEKEKTEVTAFATGIAIIVMLVGGVLSLFWFSRLP